MTKLPLGKKGARSRGNSTYTHQLWMRESSGGSVSDASLRSLVQSAWGAKLKGKFEGDLLADLSESDFLERNKISYVAVPGGCSDIPDECEVMLFELNGTNFALRRIGDMCLVWRAGTDSITDGHFDDYIRKIGPATPVGILKHAANASRLSANLNAKLIMHLIDAASLTVQSVPGDGHCCYTSFIRAVLDAEPQWVAPTIDSIRQLVADKCEEILGDAIGDEIIQECRNAALSGIAEAHCPVEAWATEPTIAVLASHFKICVTLYESGCGRLFVYDEGSTRVSILRCGNHYEWLKPNNQGEASAYEILKAQFYLVSRKRNT